MNRLLFAVFAVHNENIRIFLKRLDQGGYGKVLKMKKGLLNSRLKLRSAFFGKTMILLNISIGLMPKKPFFQS